MDPVEVDPEYEDWLRLRLGFWMFSLIRSFSASIPATSKAWMEYDSFSLWISPNLREEEYLLITLCWGALRTLWVSLSERDKGFIVLFDVELQRLWPKFRNTKYSELIRQVLDYIPIQDEELPPSREFRGNYLPRLKYLGRYFRLRKQKAFTQKFEKIPFRRGYRDKGSQSSESERARRSANTFVPKWPVSVGSVFNGPPVMHLQEYLVEFLE
jgi:hypothetical protein